METRSRPRLVARAARFTALSVVGMMFLACAAVLGIDDRELIGPGGTEAGDAPNVDAAVDGPISDADAAPLCDPTACATAKNGTCQPDGTCAIACTSATCPGSTVLACPAGHDCKVTCAANACDKLRCAGGRSCTVDCSADTSCHNGVACQSGRCSFLCNGNTDSCGGGGGSLPVECEASVCTVSCGGPGSCSGGVVAQATSYCGIQCTGASSCAVDGKLLTCLKSPDASISCGTATDTCKDSKPSCFGDYCSIACLAPASCSKDYCCEAGVCKYAGNASPTNVCP